MDKRMEAQERAKKIKAEMVWNVYRHFKGNTYMVTDIVVHSETAELLVVYARFDNNTYCIQTWASSLDMFLSDVDHEKYPDVKQKKRFERIE